ncbi:MAG: glutamate formiminotransferase/formiminotetrahydrofolate cyclodeaminase [bacterium]|jgi:glutamate formiminotransferase/formiminotetrahydrofolate cyclodeaminase
MKKLIECVPNFSEGRNQETLRKIAESIKSVAGTSLLDIDSGEAANRTVFTMIGTPNSIEESAFRAIKTASELIDMKKHQGVHPRIGATDVCPFIPLQGSTLDDCDQIAQSVAQRIGSELDIPSYFYEYSAKTPERKNLASCRQGEYEGISKKIVLPKWKPDFGNPRFNSKSGISVIGARDFLIAYNVNLETQDLRKAKQIAGIIRESGTQGKHGLLKGVKAIGWYIEEYGFCQVSTNIINFRVTSVEKTFDTIQTVANELGVKVTGSELIGLIPKVALSGGILPQNEEKQKILAIIEKLGFSQLTPFDIERKVLEYAFESTHHQ